jgi:hypothetical protein
MKQEKGPIQKLQAAAGMRTTKSPCGTLSYLAECRGVTQKSVSLEHKKRADMLHRFERHYPADR